MDGLAAIAAIIGAVASIIFSGLSYKNTLKTIEQHELLEQKKINANIISKSRIAWINDVRELTANIINMLMSYDKNEYSDLKLEYELRKEIELLKLYFSSHSDKKEEQLTVNDLKKKLFNKNGNSNKNKYLIHYVDILYNRFISTDYIHRNQIIFGKKKVLEEYWDDYYKLEVEITDVVWDDIAQEELPITIKREIPLENEERANEIWKYIISSKLTIEKLENEISETEKLLKDFGTIVSLYLKIEWDKAKNGE